MNLYYSSTGVNDSEDIVSMKWCAPFMAALRVRYVTTNQMWLTLNNYDTGAEQTMYYDDDNYDWANYSWQNGMFFSEDCTYLSTYHHDVSYDATRLYTFKLDSSTGLDFTTVTSYMPYFNHNWSDLTVIPEEAQVSNGNYMFMSRHRPDYDTRQTYAFQNDAMGSA
mgnify:CR=1 FL=1